MTKKTGLIFLALFGSFNMEAQTKAKDIVLNLGAYSLHGHYHRPPFPVFDIPALSGGAGYFVNKYISIGTYVTCIYASDKYSGATVTYTDVWWGWNIGIKSTIHFNPFLAENLANKIDIYLSGFGGYAYRALRYDKKNIYRDTLNYDVEGLGAGGMLGVRIMRRKFGVYGELGISEEFFAGGGVTYRIR